MTDAHTLPEGLPQPVNDGACDHLPGIRWPSLLLPGTDGGAHDLSGLEGRSVVYVYPMTARPGVSLPHDWDVIPGARGCTPQSCSFRDHHAELREAGARVYGLSAQSTEDQQEAASRLHLPFPLLSDSEFKLREALNLPTFQAGEWTLLKRMTFIVQGGVIEHVFYPMFPPDRNAGDVLTWLAEHPMSPL